MWLVCATKSFESAIPKSTNFCWPYQTALNYRICDYSGSHLTLETTDGISRRPNFAFHAAICDWKDLKQSDLLLRSERFWNLRFQTQFCSILVALQSCSSWPSIDLTCNKNWQRRPSTDRVVLAVQPEDFGFEIKTFQHRKNLDLRIQRWLAQQKFWIWENSSKIFEFAISTICLSCIEMFWIKKIESCWAAHSLNWWYQDLKRFMFCSAQRKTLEFGGLEQRTSPRSILSIAQQKNWDLRKQRVQFYSNRLHAAKVWYYYNRLFRDSHMEATVLDQAGKVWKRTQKEARSASMWMRIT